MQVNTAQNGSMPFFVITFQHLTQNKVVLTIDSTKKLCEIAQVNLLVNRSS